MRAIFFTAALCILCGGQAALAQMTQAGIDAALRRRAEAQQKNTPVQGFSVPEQNQARSTAETVYNTWRLSMIRGSEPSWRSSTSLARQVKVRNLIVSQRGSFPRDFFSALQEPPNLENFHFVGALTGCRGRTLAATYVGKMQLTGGQAQENAYVLEFVFEDGKWKLDQTRFFNLSQLPEVRKRLHAHDLTILQEQDGFQPYTSIPKAPPACKAPELIGKVFVDCPGRTVEMTVNGISIHEFDDERRADVISGGLKRGKNTITYRIADRAQLQRPGFGIGVFVMPETPGNTPVCVFDHVLGAEDNAAGGTFTFTIANEHIASMNPKFSGEKPQPYHAVPLKQKTGTQK